MAQNLTDKTVLVTGANSGIGYAFCVEAVRQQAKQVIVAGRDAARVAAAVAALGPTAVAEIVDLSSLVSIDAFVARARKSYGVIDVLVNNAGIVLTPHAKSAEGFEITLATNLIGLAHPTNSLVSNVSASSTGRIVIVTATPIQFSSAAAVAARLRDVGGKLDTATTFGSYIDSKVFASLYGQALQRYLAARAGSEHVLVASCDVGPVLTDITRKTAPGILGSLMWCVVRLPFVAMTPAKGALSVIFCATSAEIAAHPGAVWTEGPKVKRFALKPYFNDENRDAAWAAINAAIKSTGRSAL